MTRSNASQLVFHLGCVAAALFPAGCGLTLSSSQETCQALVRHLLTCLSDVSTEIPQPGTAAFEARVATNCAAGSVAVGELGTCDAAGFTACFVTTSCDSVVTGSPEANCPGFGCFEDPGDGLPLKALDSLASSED